MPISLVSPDQMKELRLALFQSTRQFGVTLKRAINPSSRRGFSHVYIMALESGKRKITEALARAFWRIASAHDDTDPDIATAQIVTLFAMENIKDALVTGHSRRCARPGCPVVFFPHHPQQKYHSIWCRERVGR